MTPLFSSIGGLIIDDIVYQDGKRVQDVLGGGGVFAIYGMRLWHMDSEAKDVGYIVHKGFDYPSHIDEQIEQLDISIRSIHHPDKHTTRGLNTFGKNDHRDFEYIHPIIRVTADDYPDSWIQSLKVLHLICAAERAIEIVDQWRTRERQLNAPYPTQFIWEPLPWDCLPESLDRIIEATKRVDIISPNHEELAGMLGFCFDDLLGQQGHDVQHTVEYLAQQFVSRLQSCTLVVRVGKYGAMVLQEASAHWVPAYWNRKEDSERVVDVTGAGNTFCGGFAYGWVKTKGDACASAYYGAVAASYAVEQVGVPDVANWKHKERPEDRLNRLKTQSCIF
ncbi:Ribokinase-like protein [Blakeslea trispora]|nr:Ribokinase-like protein [Blakeslea trispora]